MNTKEILFHFQKQRFEVFKLQDSESDDFDIIFEIDQNKLYAHKFMLSLISDTFKAMLSDRWISKDQPIPLEGYLFQDFKEFLTFIYSGECNLSPENIQAMIDMSEFYNIQIFKDYCIEYLTKMKINYHNILPLYELSYKYSIHELQTLLNSFFVKYFIKCDQFQYRPPNIPQFLNSQTSLILELFEFAYKYSILDLQNSFNVFNKKYFFDRDKFSEADFKIRQRYLESQRVLIFELFKLTNEYSVIDVKMEFHKLISKHFSMFVNCCREFLILPKNLVNEIVIFNADAVFPEEIFEPILKWAEFQAHEKQKLSNEAIKNELTEFLPLIKFSSMKIEYLTNFVATKSYLFSSKNQFNEILADAQSRVFVIFTNKYGKKLKSLAINNKNDEINELIERLKSTPCFPYNEMYAYWPTKQPIPTTPCLKQKDCIQWFLVFDSDGDTAIRYKTLIRSCSYIIGEMIAENGFALTEDLKIDVYQNF